MTEPRGDSAAASELSVDDWLAELAARLPLPLLEEVGTAERAVLLDLARVAAHRSHRTAAPISTYLLGLALGPQARADRLVTMQKLVAELDAG